MEMKELILIAIEALENDTSTKTIWINGIRINKTKDGIEINQ